MSTATAPAPPGGATAHVPPVVVQLARRSLLLVTRVPSAFVPAVVFPLFLIVAFSGAFSAVTDLPGFPTDRVLNWYVPLAIVQGSAFIGVGTGLGTTRDIESGFYDRLLLAPTPRLALVLGPSLGAVTRALLPFVVVLAVGFLGGARVDGPLGLVTLFAAAAGTCLLHSFWCLGIAFRAKSQRMAPLMQVGVFVSLFLATAQVPLAVMTGWLHDVARVNPMTNVLRLGRAGFVGADGVTWAECAGGLLALAVGVGLALVWALRGFRSLVP